LSKKFIPYIQLALGMTFTGAHVVAGKAVSSTFPIFFASGITLAATSFLFFLYFFLKPGPVPRPDRRSFLFILLQAFTGIFIFRIGILKGLSYTGAIEGGIILSSTPILIAFLSFLFLKESITLKKIIALLFSVGGILIINLLSADGSSGRNILLGSLFLSAAVFGEALFTVLRRVIGTRVGAVANAAYTSLAGALFFLPLMLMDLPKTTSMEFIPQDWLILFFYGTAAPMVAFTLWFSGVSNTSGSTAGVFTAILPISTMIFSTLFLREPLFPYHALGAACIIIGIFFVIEKQRNRKLTS